MTTLAITPVYNEEKVIVRVLDEIKKHVDYLIVVNDGSTDSSAQKIVDWKRRHQGVFFITSPRNEGCSIALKRGYALVAHLVRTGVLDPDDLVIELDADGQHDPAYIRALFDRWRANDDFDIVLAQRDFSKYPVYKVIGNRGLTWIAALLGGVRYKDVESNYRVTPAGVFHELLKFYTGYGYSAAFEIGIILGRLKYRTDNDFVVNVPYYRSGARASDGFHVLLAGLYTWARVCLGRTHDVRAFIEETVACCDGHSAVVATAAAVHSARVRSLTREASAVSGVK